MVDALKYRSEPRYNLLANDLRERIKSGQLKPGDRLPSFPAMRAQGVSQPTLDRVHRILEHEGLIVREARRGVFVKSPEARTTRGLLGVLSHNLLGSHPYYTQLLAGVQDEAHRRHAEVLLLLEEAQPRWELLDGCVVMTRAQHKTVELPDGLPGVNLMFDESGAPSVTVDEAQGIRDAMDYLYGLGHRRIAYMTMELNFRADTRRIETYRKWLIDHGIASDPSWIKRLKTRKHFHSFVDLGRSNMEEWLQKGWPHLGCTALLVQNDEAAWGAMQALQDAGIRIPEQVSVVGFDDLEMSMLMRPNLSTVHVPLHAAGAAAAAMLLDREQEPKSVVLPVRFIARDSTAPPAA